MIIFKATRPRRRVNVRTTHAHTAAVRVEAEMRRVVLQAIRRASGSTRLDFLVTLLQSGKTDVRGAFGWAFLAAELANLVQPIRRAMVAAGAAEARSLAPEIGHVRIVKQEITGSLNLSNPRAVRAANEQAARLVTRITRETERAIRALIARAQARGVSVPQQADEIADELRQSFGLTERQATALDNFRAALREKELADDVIEQRVAALRERYIRDRALTIARHESISAANAGVNETWKEAVDQGFLPEDIGRRWLAAKDERVCPICEPMDGQVRKLGEDFVSPYDGTTVNAPPAHILCRCTVTLDL